MMFIPFPLDSGGLTGGPGVLLTALALDAALGDPNWLYRAIPHPVAALGKLIGVFERRLNRADLNDEIRRRNGFLITTYFTAAALLLGWFAAIALANLSSPVGWLAQAVLVSVLLAFRGLYDHVTAVVDGLGTGLDAGRDAVKHIVGRDPASLDEAGVARAAIESTAENLSDGVVAPIFWFLLLGLPGLFAYKTINTLDSMIGYRNTQYADFGRAAAKLDDLVNWPAARITGLLIVLAAFLTRDGRPGDALSIMWRDARKHRSPNAGWPEAAMAGALGLSLGGPRLYGADHVEDPWLGEGRRDATADDIRAALRLYRVAGWLLGGILLVFILL